MAKIRETYVRMLDRTVKRVMKLERQIKRMRNCYNCNWGGDSLYKGGGVVCDSCDKLSSWKMKGRKK